MRQLEYVTLIDPLVARFGRRWSVVLAVPAMLGELLWSAELLVAIGATCGVLLGIDLVTAILVSAAVVTGYTVLGGMWSVGYTDTVQFLLIPLGMLLVLPFALSAAGGWDACWAHYVEIKQSAAAIVPPLATDSFWTAPRIVGWWDLSIMLVLGGIPWNCYFQRIQSCQTPRKAAMALGDGRPDHHGDDDSAADAGYGGIRISRLDAPRRPVSCTKSPTMALPMLLADATPPAVAILGLAAIVGAVTSSFSASILSAGSMISWNVVRGLYMPNVSVGAMRHIIRVSIVALGRWRPCWRCACRACSSCGS